jgi:hypothetical protein
MDQIDETLNRYEEDLKKAKEGGCKKVSRCTDFREGFRKDYLEIYKSKLEEVRKKVRDFLAKVFDETIILDFTPTNLGDR